MKTSMLKWLKSYINSKGSSSVRQEFKQLEKEFATGVNAKDFMIDLDEDVQKIVADNYWDLLDDKTKDK